MLTGGKVAKLRTSQARRDLVILFTGAVFVSGCSVRLSVGEVTTKQVYKATLQADLSDIHAAAKNLHPACDRGGSVSACMSASSAMVDVLDRMQSSLGHVSVPTGYAPAHTRLMAAVAAEVKGFQLRNQGLSENDNTKWIAGNQAVGAATLEIDAAIKEYPSS